MLSATKEERVEHVIISYDAERFAAWPFAHGVWAYPDGEVVAGFTRAACAYQRSYDVHHGSIDTQSEYVVARAADGGATWPEENVTLVGTRAELTRVLRSGLAPAAPDEVPDWASPDFCLTAGYGIPPDGAKQLGYVQYSRDRGRTWDGPYPIPDLGFAHVQVKPDYIVRPDGLVLLFVTVGRKDVSPGARHPGMNVGVRFVAVYASPDSGRTWRYLSSILPATPDSAYIERYYASPVQLADGRILAALRCQLDGSNGWPELWASTDGGRSWSFVNRISDWGQPTHLLGLRDGRLLAVYGYRVPPFGIRARVSEDEGLTWGEELVLRDDGGSLDLGYPRSVQLSDGRVLSVYYFNRADDAVQCEGGVRHIAGTIFMP